MRDQTERDPNIPIMLNVRTVSGVATPGDRQIQQLLHKELEKTLFNVDRVVVCKGTITVTAKGPAMKGSERSLLISAIQIVVADALDELNLQYLYNAINVVFLPGSEKDTVLNRARTLPYKMLYNGHCASMYIENQGEGLCNFLLQSVQEFVSMMLSTTIKALPWRDEKVMWLKVAPLVQRAVNSFSERRADLLLNGCVDEILPPPDAFLCQMDYPFMMEEITRYFGKPPQTRLHFYEFLYEYVSSVSKPLETACVLFDAVFHNIWDDYMLDENDIYSTNTSDETSCMPSTND